MTLCDVPFEAKIRGSETSRPPVNMALAIAAVHRVIHSHLTLSTYCIPSSIYRQNDRGFLSWSRGSDSSRTLSGLMLHKATAGTTNVAALNRKVKAGPPCLVRNAPRIGPPIIPIRWPTEIAKLAARSFFRHELHRKSKSYGIE